ncbi:RNA-binding domain-containing protein [Methanoplanus limicola]|uniref:Putative transcriptional regulator n=1 Tax=Methanoplanus limicola DSM 2279 TaxID=937775 RepID=H1Z4G8_9EURY|nr:RNA-binding domain-containing protein [Methanoplanus limicola]EHQ36716.1 putative transcriptional regulator [Methanoplanus limicola DSM 2279]
MKQSDLALQIAAGEDSTHQFKVDVRSGESIAAEMAAFANSKGGTIYIGVADDSNVPGLTKEDVSRINQLISNAASQQVRSPLSVHTENVVLETGRVVIVLTVPKGIYKPYFDKNGVIWLKTGSDKRRINSKEELRRLFQVTDQFHADEVPTKAGIDKLDNIRFRDFLKSAYKQDVPSSSEELIRLLQNMNLATDDGMLNLAGVLMFAERPEWVKPQFIVKAICYPGNDIHISEYLDTENYEGPFQKVFESSLAFIMRNLHKVQAGRGINSPGLPEVPESVFEELLVNALVHRDYFVSAPIRIFIFDNRIEIISPGHLPNNLTVEKIRTGNSNIRNPILVSYVAKGLLPYHGLGSGIKRALEQWPDIDFEDDREGCKFTVTVHRKVQGVLLGMEEHDEIKGQGGVLSGLHGDLLKSNFDLINVIKSNPRSDYKALAKSVGVSEATVKRHIQKLKNAGILRRIGSKKTGHWEIISDGAGQAKDQ